MTTSAQIDSAFTNAYRFRDRVPENARNMIIGGYFSSGPGRDRGRAVAAYEAVLRNGDTTSGAANNLALLLMNTDRAEEAVSLLTEAVELKPDVPEFKSNLNLAIEAVKLGALDYLSKPLDFARFAELLSGVRYHIDRRKRLLAADTEIAATSSPSPACTGAAAQPTPSSSSPRSSA